MGDKSYPHHTPYFLTNPPHSLVPLAFLVGLEAVSSSDVFEPNPSGDISRNARALKRFSSNNLNYPKEVTSLKWVTREFVHVDRTACPWLIKKFIDPHAEFIFVPTDKIGDIVKDEGATPFDAPGVKLGHKDGKCSFETIVEEYKLKDPALHELAKIVHSADTQDTSLAPEGIGLSAVMTGARFNVKDDFEAVERAAYVYDALFSYCKFKLLREKFKDELGKMSRVEQREFLVRKMREKAI